MVRISKSLLMKQTQKIGFNYYYYLPSRYAHREAVAARDTCIIIVFLLPDRGRVTQRASAHLIQQLSPNDVSSSTASNVTRAAFRREAAIPRLWVWASRAPRSKKVAAELGLTETHPRAEINQRRSFDRGKLPGWNNSEEKWHPESPIFLKMLE